MRTPARLVVLLLAALPLVFPQSEPPAPPKRMETTDSKAPKQPTPTVFQREEGDRWMLLGDKPLIFKVDPLSNGSDTLVVGTEEMPPGNIIPTHKHLYEDEVIFVHKGVVRVTLAGREYDAGT
jgi:quercetin dioxygenase-like cupin family protein